jgi:hypothetical protein
LVLKLTSTLTVVQKDYNMFPYKASIEELKAEITAAT